MRRMRGQIWISAILYFALAIIILSLVLAAGVPLVNQLKDRNTVAETKNILFTIDEAIQIVVREGPGSQRELSPLSLTAGQLFIEEVNDTIRWELETSAQVMEVNVPIKEGVLDLFLKQTVVKNNYILLVERKYENSVDIDLESQYGSPFSGRFSMLVTHNGTFSTNAGGIAMPVVRVTVL